MNHKPIRPATDSFQKLSMSVLSEIATNDRYDGDYDKDID